MNAYTAVLLGTGITFAATIFGSATVFLFKDKINPNFQRGFLGFAAGVMIAASVFSLLIPATEMAAEQGVIKWLPAAGGFLLGGIFLLVLDNIIPHVHIEDNMPEGIKSSFKRTTMLVFAVTLHNIPEGMSVGLCFALAASGSSTMTMMASFALAIGIAIQNFPEGAAISLPLKQEGMSKGKSFIYGALSGIVEPIGGLITVAIAGTVSYILPWLLGFAAGAMIYVVVEELIPEAHTESHTDVGTMGVMIGFLIMMILDIALG
ncbi:ZIP family metal transporter [Clostridium sp. SM-530-WT-3G]|uniref:ZIP family metal transporter n=1 Tax=Clostridium sp. SM-530-WT-3G TaxID=2725303 RepID=UPI00145D8318|nr:ZIP family metal transporter [Clostridium sp. SM-530-WT-3G]NME84337.1 ZIP family metal transporter [Clostridium sp. SM-530-WT-3G]